MCESSLPALGSSPSWNLQTLGQRVPCLPSFITDSAGQGSCAWGRINSLFPPLSFKQQNLEQRQADVEYELRCLLNKPEKDWTEEDRGREKVLMQEIVTLIEQRNAIINCLDEDRQR